MVLLWVGDGATASDDVSSLSDGVGQRPSRCYKVAPDLLHTGLPRPEGSTEYKVSKRGLDLVSGWVSRVTGMTAAVAGDGSSTNGNPH